MPIVEFRDVSYAIGGKRILDRLSFAVDAGETLVLLGRSGSGKTTALKLTNGMLMPTAGQVLVEGKPTAEWNPIALKRRIGYVIQDVGLFPHYNVGANVGLVPKLERWDTARIAQRVVQLLEKVAKNMMGRTICALSDAAAMPTISFVNKFRDEFEYFVREGRSKVSNEGYKYAQMHH